MPFIIDKIPYLSALAFEIWLEQSLKDPDADEIAFG